MYSKRNQDLIRQRSFIRKYILEHKTVQVEFVDGYLDPIFINRKVGCGYRGSSKIRVGKLFLLGKVY